MKSIFRKAKIAVASLAVAAGLAFGTAKGQSTGTVEGIYSMQPEKSYVRPTITYVLPVDVKGSSFAEFYKDGSYVTKTTLSKDIYGSLGAIAHMKTGTAFDTKIGVGAYGVLPMPKGTYAKAYIVPLWIDVHGEQKKSVITGYYVSIDLPLEMKLSSFGEIDMTKSPKWTYGEISLEKKLTDDISVSYQPALRGIGGMSSKIEHRLDLKVKL